jgi:hypothetical protein
LIYSIPLSDPKEEPASKKAKTMSNISSFFKRESLELMVSEMAAVNGFSFRGIAQCKYIRKSLIRDGYNLMSDSKAVGQMVQPFA